MHEDEEFAEYRFREPDRAWRKLGEALAAWQDTYDVSAELPWATVTATSPYADEEEDSPSFPVLLRETAVGDLQELLTRDAAARTGTEPPGNGATPAIAHAAARLAVLLTSHGVMPEADVLRDPETLRSALKEVGRAIRACEYLVERAGEALQDELEAGSLLDTGTSGAGTSPAAGVAGYFDVARHISETAIQLDQLVTKAAALRREVSVRYSTSQDGPTLTSQWLVEAALLHDGPGRYHVRLFRPAGRKPVAVMADLRENRAASVRAGTAPLARTVAAYLLDGALGDAVDWIVYMSAGTHSQHDHGPGRPERRGFDRNDRAYQQFLGPKFDLRGEHGVSHEELEAFAGGPVGRWHIADYTVAAVTAAGATLIELPKVHSLEGTDSQHIVLRCRRQFCREEFTAPAGSVDVRCPRCGADRPEIRSP